MSVIYNNILPNSEMNSGNNSNNKSQLKHNYKWRQNGLCELKES